MSTFTDALRIQRLNTMRRRSSEAQAKARRDAGTCSCMVCQIRRGGLADLLQRAAQADAEDSPASVEAIAPSRAQPHAAPGRGDAEAERHPGRAHRRVPRLTPQPRGTPHTWSLTTP
jgi:hypothetical protein